MAWPYALLVLATFAAWLMVSTPGIWGDSELRVAYVRAVLGGGSPGPGKYSIVGPMFALPLAWLDRALATPDWFLLRFNIFVSVLGAAYLIALGIRTGSLTAHLRLVLVWLCATTYPGSLATFYGEPFTSVALATGFLNLFPEEVRKQHRVKVPLDDHGALQFDGRRRKLGRERPQRVAKHHLVVWVVLAHSQRDRTSFAASARPAGTLQVVGWVGRHVVHGHYANATNIHAHLHGRRAAQQVDLSLLELVLVILQGGTGLLR